jgi:chemotaxis protein methyltransferase CheR
LSIAPSPGELDRFRAILAARLGLHLDATHDADVAACLGSRLDASRGGTAEYLGRLAAGDVGELRAIAAQLTVGETYFFRNPNHFRALADRAAQRRPEAGALRLLSAGCASGEEAYTAAIILREHLDAAAFARLQIIGIDVNAAVIEKARRGRYSAWSMRATARTDQDRWFKKQGGDLVLQPELVAKVQFEERNLLQPDAAFWASARFDVIFCRNVLIYFSPDAVRRVVAQFADALVPGGFLFLGDAENLRGISQDFHLHHTHDTFYYERRAEGDRAMPRPSVVETWRTPWREDPAPVVADDSWVTNIQAAAERIAQLTAAPATAAPPSRRMANDPVPSIAAVMQLMKREQYAEAITELGRLPDDADSDVRLLRATLLLNAGRVAEAREAAEQLLARDELEAGAHYVLALCHEHAGDFAAARRHDETAVYLDPAFAMPRFHLGRLARRCGDLSAACGELRRAADLLSRDDAARILLFGGGFGREALIQVCRAELLACGGSDA